MRGEARWHFHVQMISERYKRESIARDRMIAHFVKGVWTLVFFLASPRSTATRNHIRNRKTSFQGMAWYQRRVKASAQPTAQSHSVPPTSYKEEEQSGGRTQRGVQLQKGK